MPDVVLATVNARYSHCSLGLRCLEANLGPLTDRAAVLELTLDDRPADACERILALSPQLVGFGVYIWNVALLTELVELLRAVAPELKIVLGGPEVSFADDLPSICEHADAVIAGEGEALFPRACEALLTGHRIEPRFVPAAPPDLSTTALPYDRYTDEDIARRTIYVEASRGCPHRCEFCLAALDRKVRRFPEDAVLVALLGLWERGARRFKFVDRALSPGITPRILEFLLERAAEGLFVHFELIPDRLTDEQLDWLGRFPPGAVQLEAGVQTLDPPVAERIARDHDPDRAVHNLRRLRDRTGVHLHADLLVGLPGEDIEGIARSFDRLLATGVHEIQVGVLKRLRGAPIARHDARWQMVYRSAPPYDVLATSAIDFATMQRLKRFARYFDLVYNSGNFCSTAPLLLQGRPFESFLGFSDWLHARVRRTFGIALDRLAALLLEYLVGSAGVDRREAASLIAVDLVQTGRPVPRAIREHARPECLQRSRSGSRTLPARQRRRLGRD